MTRHTAITASEIAEIQYRWRHRVTIARLAKEYSITPDQVRTIIATPEREDN